MLNFRIAFALVCLLAAHVGAELGEKPLSLRQVEDLVKANADGTRIAEAIRTRGVDFLASDACVVFFRGLGAGDEVQAALRSEGQVPYSTDSLLREVARRPGDPRFAESVRTRGISFLPTAEDLDTLRVAGADAGMIDAVRSARVRSEAQFEPCPPDAGKTGIAESPSPGETVTPTTPPTEPAGVDPTRGGEPTKAIAVVSGEVSASPRLVGGLDIVTSPPGLEVMIDGQSYGPSPIHTALTEGEHRYRVKPEGLRAFEKKFTITSGTIRILHLSFVPLPVPPTGTLVVETNPPGAAVDLDGGSFGGWTPATFELAAGPHQLRLSLDGYRPVARAVEVGADRTMTLREDLRRAGRPVRRPAEKQGK